MVKLAYLVDNQPNHRKGETRNSKGQVAHHDPFKAITPISPSSSLPPTD